MRPNVPPAEFEAIVKAAQPAIAALGAAVNELAQRVDLLAAGERIRLAQIEFTNRTNFAKYIIGACARSPAAAWATTS